MIYFYFSDNTPGMFPTPGLVCKLSENTNLLPTFSVTVRRLVNPFTDPAVQDRVCGQSEHKFHVILPGCPIHEFFAAKMSVASDDEAGLLPVCAHHVDQPPQDTGDVGRLVTPAGTKQWQDHFTGDTLEDEQGHITVLIVIIVEKRALLVSVGVEITVVAVKDDTVGFFAVRGDEFFNETDTHIIQFTDSGFILQTRHRRLGA